MSDDKRVDPVFRVLRDDGSESWYYRAAAEPSGLRRVGPYADEDDARRDAAATIRAFAGAEEWRVTRVDGEEAARLGLEPGWYYLRGAEARGPFETPEQAAACAAVERLGSALGVPVHPDENEEDPAPAVLRLVPAAEREAAEEVAERDSVRRGSLLVLDRVRELIESGEVEDVVVLGRDRDGVARMWGGPTLSLAERVGLLAMAQYQELQLALPGPPDTEEID